MFYYNKVSRKTIRNLDKNNVKVFNRYSRILMKDKKEFYCIPFELLCNIRVKK